MQGFSDYDSVGPQAQSISYDDDYDLTAQCLNLAHDSGLTNTYCKAWFEDNQGNCTSSETISFSLGRFVPDARRVPPSTAGEKFRATC